MRKRREIQLPSSIRESDPYQKLQAHRAKRRIPSGEELQHATSSSHPLAARGCSAPPSAGQEDRDSGRPPPSHLPPGQRRDAAARSLRHRVKKT